VRALAQLLVLGGVQRGADALGGVDLHLRGLALELLQAVQPRGQLRHAGACERGLGDVLLGGAGLLQPGLQLVAHFKGQGRQGAALHFVQGQRGGLALERPGQVRQVRGVHQRILRQRRLRGLGRLGGVARLALGLVRGGGCGGALAQPASASARPAQASATVRWRKGNELACGAMGNLVCG
jgi:hypothetical protein